MERKLFPYESRQPDDEPTTREGPGPASLVALVTDSLRLRRDPGDAAFDRLLPRELELASTVFWTPLNVALRVADWFDDFEVRSVVDIGSGAGKFCIAAALSSDIRVLGIEQRPRLVDAARQMARLFHVEERVEFVNATVGNDPLPIANAYYLFNSFGENLFSPEECLDQDVELGAHRFRRDLEALGRLLERAPVGTLVFTYNGIGRALPSCYDEVRVARDLRNVLKASRKNR